MSNYNDPSRKEGRAKKRANRDENDVSLDPNCPHGTYNGYNNYFCHCAGCRRANAEYQSRKYARKRHNRLFAIRNGLTGEK